MTQGLAIVGFRQDRIGARLICMLNVMRLSRKFGVPGRYLWLSQPDGPYPELVDPRDFLASEFVAAHIDIVAHAPERSGLRNLPAAAPGMNGAGFARTLAEGQRYECDAMSEIVRFMDESEAEAAEGLRAAAAELALSPRLTRALARARRILAGVGGGQPLAIHVRRGDILDGDPWSYSSWASKYVPDEFFRAFVADREGPVIAFSDTPAAVGHLRRGDPRILPVNELLDHGRLSAAERDLLELLLMAGCAEVGAPSHSAFSRAAAMIGHCRIVALPGALPADAQLENHDALLDRVIAQPDSFFAPGDLAQSVSYAARHAASCGRGTELVDALAGRLDLLERFPFLYRELALLAWSAGRRRQARELAQRGLAVPSMRNRDKPQCRQVLLVTGGRGGDADGPGGGLDAGFLDMLFAGRAAEGLIMPGLAHRLMREGGAAGRALGFAPELLAVHAQPDPVRGKGRILPLWVLRIDWSEFVRDPGPQREMLLWPDLWRKLEPFGERLAGIEAGLAKGGNPVLDDKDAAWLGFCASVLRLHGRLNRAFAILHWLDAARPGRMLTRKRLADACFAAGNRKAGWRWLDAALETAPDQPLLRLSAALRAVEGQDRARAEAHLRAAEAVWPELRLTETLHRALRRQMRAGAPADAAADVACAG
ncbi:MULTISPECIES: tetratricopeptide repeat protein [Paracoccus]|jgi:hypothetical protein|uniref:tetratricopeptide repeat protein n=1 Tax=Paracoccus TaxID=265 RepID=UPI0025830880|nr:hypothetical protein [Paracoccus sp. (in: a-proteobacteria)]